jgi:effector-binding domain-containing protein
MISIIHTGPYSEVGGAYMKALEFLNANGLKLGGRCRELYLNDPRSVPESGLLTEIQIPLG